MIYKSIYNYGYKYRVLDYMTIQIPTIRILIKNIPEGQINKDYVDKKIGKKSTIKRH